MGAQESDVEMVECGAETNNEPDFREGIIERIINSNKSGEYTNHPRVARRSHDNSTSTFAENEPTSKRVKENEAPLFSNSTVAMETTTPLSSSTISPAEQLSSSDDILVEVGL